MPKSEHLVPTPGRLVRDSADMQPLPPEGAVKPLNAYWRRRLDDGDVHVASEPPAPARAAGGKE